MSDTTRANGCEMSCTAYGGSAAFGRPDIKCASLAKLSEVLSCVS
jgi:hypothetical protein